MQYLKNSQNLEVTKIRGELAELRYFNGLGEAEIRKV